MWQNLAAGRHVSTWYRQHDQISRVRSHGAVIHMNIDRGRSPGADDGRPERENICKKENCIYNLKKARKNKL